MRTTINIEDELIEKASSLSLIIQISWNLLNAVKL